MTAMTTYRVWWRYSREPWQVSDERLGYSEAEAHANAEHRQRLNPMHTIRVLPEGEQPPPDQPFRPGPPEVLSMSAAPGSATDGDEERHLTLRFEVTDPTISDDALIALADRIVAEQVNPDPPVLTYEGATVDRIGGMTTWEQYLAAFGR